MVYRFLSLMLIGLSLLQHSFAWSGCGCACKEERPHRGTSNANPNSASNADLEGDSQMRLTEVNYKAVVSSLGLSNPNAQYTFLLTDVTSSDAECSGSCFQTLTPNAQQWVNILSNGGWIDLEYDVCYSLDADPIVYDAQGNPSCRYYAGHFGVTFTAQATTISNASGGTASLSPYVSGQPFAVTFISDTQPPAADFPTPTTYSSVEYRGINIAGGEFEYQFIAPYPSDALYYVQQGMNTVRIPFLWEYLQPNLSVPIDFTTGPAKSIVELVNILAESKIYVLVDMHNYMRYTPNFRSGSQGGSSNQPQYIIGDKGSPVTTQNYADAWASIARQFANNPFVFFDLMNEPHDMRTELILTNYNAAIAAIRAAGANNLVLLEGNNWTGLNSWGESWGYTPNSEIFRPENIVDSANNYAINVHQYFTSSTGGGSGLGACVSPSQVLDIENFDFFKSWLKETKQRAFLSEIGGESSSNCYNDIDVFLTAVESVPNTVVNGSNTGGFIGWTAWTGGHAWDGTNYPLDLDPSPSGQETIQMVEGFEPHLTPPPV